ncbi:MAG: Crp/Fnr family transcriptional regulator [Acidobacteriota bacterium]|nr:Crp/Fnr family transcriptional regulator [Acidobacteriota bacterium]
MKSPKALGNLLLSKLPGKERRRIDALLETHDWSSGESLHDPGKRVNWVYFPVDGVASLVTRLSDGSCVEAATTGNEGIVGLPIFLETGSASIEAFVQIPGRSLRMNADVFRDEIRRNSNLRRLADAYTRALLRLVGQSAACNRKHPTEQRCSRWLLMSHDRVQADTFHLTQEFLAEMLGIRRPAVTGCAGELRRKGLITYRRGWITVLDRRGLEKASCECYAVIRHEFDQIA